MHSSIHIKMESSSVCDDSSEREYHPSPRFSMPRSIIDTECSTPDVDSLEFSRTFSQISLYSEQNGDRSSSFESSPRSWPMKKPGGRSPVLTKLATKLHSDVIFDKSSEESNSELELMKERFSKLLLGEDMSGSGKGVCTAVALSNAVTNLYATVFSNFWKLEPMSYEKRTMWRREMDLLLSVCDYIVEFFPSTQTMRDGSTIEVMETRSRSDIYVNLPALEKLDSMLLDILDSFEKTEFWYVDEENIPSTATASRSFRRLSHRNEEKWWLPVPCVPPLGLSEKARKELQKKRECANQIHKAAMAINDSILAEMEVPETYLATLPKCGRTSVGDMIYRYTMTTEKFSPEHLLGCLDITSEHDALETADKIEAGMHVWRRKAGITNSKSSWDMVKDFMADGDKNHILASRAESLLLCLKQRYPGLSQTTLDTCKIQYNKDIGQAVLESYSRVLESLAFKIVSWIDDVLYIDGVVRNNHPLKQR